MLRKKARIKKSRGFVRLLIVTFLVTSTGLDGNFSRVGAAPATSPTCTSGVGFGGQVSSDALSQGGHGCVVIEYNSQFETFNFTGVIQSWTVPTGITSVVFYAIGAGGGGGRSSTSASGGGGGYATGTYGVTAGQVFTIIVGQGGVRQSPADVAVSTNAEERRNASFGGGASGQGTTTYGSSFGSGGGRSAVRLASDTDDLLTAGGGGGGGYTSSGGAGGGLIGASGSGSGGQGGTQVSGGATHPTEPGVAGIKYAGGYAGTVLSGNAASEGGGGGGGWYGGGGAGDNGGGGGGSSYIALLTNGATSAGSGRTPGIVIPSNAAAPTISGATTVGAVLSATAGMWSGTGAPSWSWQVSNDGVTYTNVSGANTNALTVAAPGYYRAVETHTNIIGATTATSNSIRVLAPVVISAPSTPDLATSSDSGDKSDDNVTNDNTPTLHVSGTSTGDTVTVTATKGSDNRSCVFTAMSSVTSCDLPLLADGSWTVSAARVDTSNVASPASATLTLTIDTVRPSNESAPTVASTSTFTVSNAEQDSTVTVSATKGTDVVACTYFSTTSSSCAISTLTPGTWTVTSVIVDRAGNASLTSPGLVVTIESASTTTSTTTTTVVATPIITTTTSTAPRISTTTTTSTLPNSLIPYDSIGRERVTDGPVSVIGLPKGGWARVERSNTESIVTTSDGLRIVLGAQSQVERNSQINENGILVFEPSDLLTFSGSGLLPGSPASAWLFSTPRELGKLSVDATGSFDESYVVDSSVEAGEHTAQLIGIAPDGTLRVIELKIEVQVPAFADTSAVSATSDVNELVPENEQPDDQPVAIGLIANALALLAVAGRPKTQSSSGDGNGDDASSTEASAREEPSSAGDESAQVEESTEGESSGGEVSSVATGFADRTRDDRTDRIRPPHSKVVDATLVRSAALCNRYSPLAARIIDDASYLRAITGIGGLLLPVAGMVLGVVCALAINQTIAVPSAILLISIALIGVFDSLAGAIFVATFGLTTVIGGGLDSLAAVRGFLGFAVFAFGIPLVAAATRPFRRTSRDDRGAWTLAVDVVLLSIFGAWAAGTMYSMIPALIGQGSQPTAHVDSVHIVVLVALLVRWALENIALSLAPQRLRLVELKEHEDPSLLQRMFATSVRTVIFVIVAGSFIGNNWALWVGTLLYIAPKIVGEFSSNWPNVPMLHRFVPRNLPRVVLVLLFALWWGAFINSQFADSPDMLLYAFVLMGVPSHILGVIDWFGREGGEWPSTFLSRLLGVVTLVLGFLLVRGYILG